MKEGNFKFPGSRDTPQKRSQRLPGFALAAWFLGMLCCSPLSGQESSGCKGQVLNSQGVPIAGALIYRGTTSSPIYTDTAGYFQARQGPGSGQLTITAPGYTARTVSPDFSQAKLFQIYLPRLTRDSIPKESIAFDSLLQRMSSGDTTSGYRRLLYEQRQAYLYRVPWAFWPISGFLLPRKQDTGLIYWREGLFRDQWQKAGHFHRHTLQKREGGHIIFGEDFTLADWQLDLRQAKLHFKREYALSLPGPLSPSGRKDYHYQLEGHYLWDTLKVYRFRFRPASHRPQSLQGRVDIREDGALLHTRYRLPGPHRLPLYDSMQVRQIYQPDAPGEPSRLLRQEMDYFFQLLGFQASFHIEQSIRESGPFDPALQPAHFPYEVDRFPQENYQSSPAYWDSLRPVDQLNPSRGLNGHSYEDEAIFLDSIPQRRFYRSARLFTRPFSLLKYSYRGYEFRGDSGFYGAIPALYLGLGHNAVEGPYLQYNGVLGYSRDTTEWTFYPSIRYGLADEKWKYLARLTYRYGTKHPQELSLSGGRDYSQFNRKKPVSALLNTFYSTVLGENLLRLYGRDFMSLGYEGEPRNGLALEGHVTYAQRFPLSVQASPFPWSGEDSFDPNVLELRQNSGTYRLQAHRALTWSGELSYQLGQRYRKRYSLRYAQNFRQKENLLTWLPRVYYRFRAGLPWLGGNTAYYHHAAGLRYRYRTGSLGQAYLDLSAGHFPWRSTITPIDYRHFDGTQTFFLEAVTQSTSPTNQYNTLPYYQYSTDGAYLEGHFRHDFEGSLLNRWGFWPSSRAQLQMGFNALWLSGGYYYLEGFLGLTQVWKWANLSFTSGWDERSTWQTAFRLGLALDAFFYAKHNLQ